MTLDLVPAHIRGTDRDALIAFLTTHEWPFHVRRRPTVETVTAALEDGAFDDEDHAAFCIAENGARIARGQGRGLAALPWPRSATGSCAATGCPAARHR